MKFTAELNGEEMKTLIELRELKEGKKSVEGLWHTIRNEYVDKTISQKGDVKDFIDEDLKLEVASLTQLNKALLKKNRKLSESNSRYNLLIKFLCFLLALAFCVILYTK